MGDSHCDKKTVREKWRNRRYLSLPDFRRYNMGENEDEDVIVRDSIIKNKERTKSYWEQLMMAAASENQTPGKIRVWDNTETSNSNRYFKNSYNASMNSFNGSPRKEYIENGSPESPKNPIRADLSFNSLSMEDRIALELQEQKEREEELKRLRRQLLLENSKELSPSKDMNNGNEELCSIHTNDDSNYSEYGSEEKEHSLDGNNSRVNTPYSEDFIHRRTQSLDSVSSGHSSGSASTLNDKDRDSPRRKIMVRPYEDPQEDEEEVPAYKRMENETPIEREIRISKEREEELRKEKGITPTSNAKTEQSKIQKVTSKKDAVENDPRDVQHRLATNRIQQEIEEANERENELRTEGKILTTSEERVDAKVTRFTQLAEFAILENRHKDSKMKRSLSVSHLATMDSEKSRGKESFTPVKVPAPRTTRRYAPNPASKGIMQRFIATKGRLSLPAMSTDSEAMGQPARRPLARSSTGGLDASIHVRKGYIPAGEKIQEELKEMEKREEELRLQRAYHPSSMTVRHRSQPNLLNISDDDDNNRDEDDGELHSWTSHKEHPKPAPRLAHSMSNPNLLDDSLEKMNIRLPNKRFSLLQQWENRIQSAQ